MMYLEIINWQRSDDAQFSSISTNSLGKADGRIQAYSKYYFLVIIHFRASKYVAMLW